MGLYATHPRTSFFYPYILSTSWVSEVSPRWMGEWDGQELNRKVCAAMCGYLCL